MTVLLVIGGLLAVLAVACWWEARSGKPAWGAHLDTNGPTSRDATRSGKRGIAKSAGAGVAFDGLDGGGDG